MKLSPAVLPYCCMFVLSCQTPFGGSARVWAPDDALEQVDRWAGAGQLREAEDGYRRLQRGYPRDARVARHLGMVLVQKGQYKEARSLLERAQVMEAEDAEGAYFLGEAYRGLGLMGDAVFAYKRTLQLEPRQTRALASLAWTYLKMRYYKGALKVSRRMERLAPEDAHHRLIAARIWLKLRRPKEALRSLQKQAFPEALAPIAAALEGQVWMELGDVVRAQRRFQQALKESPFLPTALLGMGKCMAAQSKAHLAVAHWEKAVRAKPDLAEGYYLLAQTLEGRAPGRAAHYYGLFQKKAASDPELLALVPRAQERAQALRRSTQPQRLGRRLP